ncbi:hypothetical protein [Nocardia sp. NPDC059229]|uniref:hypothetical protein n=1 Tax=Nocardia sp. NPDC059229 TaxID=3346778 RepID=UPI00368A4C06
MSAFSDSARPGPKTTLYDHAVALARQYPDVPLPADGKPYPNADERDVSQLNDERSDSDGTLTSQLIDNYFATPTQHRDIAQLYRTVIEYNVPIHPSPAIVEAIGRADPDQVRQLGRHLARTSTDPEPTVLGIAILAEVGTAEDVPLIQTIGLLSNTFGPLSAKALARLPDATTNLIWLADRAAGWGRVYLVGAICRLGDPAAEPWLLRKPCDGDYLNGYFAHKVAAAAPFHEAIAQPDADEDLVDHTGTLLSTLVWSQGMSGTILHYDHSEQVLSDYLSHVTRLAPNLSRYGLLWTLARFLDGHADFSPPDWATLESLRTGYWLVTPDCTAVALRTDRSNKQRTRTDTRMGVIRSARARSKCRRQWRKSVIDHNQIHCPPILVRVLIPQGRSSNPLPH